MMRTPTRSEGSPLRVLTLTRDVGGGFGGAEKIAFEFAIRLDRERFKSYVCITRAPDPRSCARTEADIAELRVSGVEVLRLERRSTASVAPWARLYALLVHERIDILHGHMPRASIPGTVLGRLAGVPVIVSQEHIWSSHRKPQRQLLHRTVVGHGSDVVLAVSERNRRNIIEAERIAPERIRVLPNAIVSATEDGHDVRGTLAVPAVATLVGAIGRLTSEKGHADLIRAVALLEQGSQDVRCVIAGAGPEEGRLRSLIEELGLTERFRLLGHREDTRQLIRALDVAVLCSHSEGSPLALLEYMAAGAPIVASAVGGIPELIDDGVHGLLVEPGNPGALAAAITRVIEDPELGARLGAAARERQRNEFDIDVIVRQLEQLYVELYDRSRRGRRTGRRG
jgi:glycosyltransferase involved in cell wall biosynthesis